MSTDTSAQRLWEAALGRLQMQTPRPTFDTWLAGTVGVRYEDGHLLVSTPTSFAAEWIERRVHSLVEEAASAVAGRRINVSYGVGREAPGEHSAPTPLASAPAAAPAPESPPLLQDHTFEAFVVGPSNQLAHAAALAAADGGGIAYNPLFIYGDVGLGKTHLLHAIAHRASGAGRAAHYLTAEEFTRNYLGAIRDKTVPAFRDRLLTARLLLIDDVQLLAGKEATQEALFHTFNDLQRAGGFLVMASDRPARQLTLLQARLRSRFEAGLQTDISPPDYETRLAMVQGFAERSGLAIDSPVLEFIAAHLESNVRALRGCFTRLTALADFTGSHITTSLARTALGPHAVSSHGLTPQRILDAVSAHYGTPAHLLAGPRRDRQTSRARQSAMHLLSTLLGLSPDEIGLILGKRDRTTVIYGLQQANSRIESDPSTAATVKTIQDSLLLNTGDGALSTPA